MEQIGVEAVVQGLASFLGDMKAMDGAVKSVSPGVDLLSGAFSTLGDIMGGVANFIANTLSHAIGELLADAVEWAAQKIQELFSYMVDLTNELQRLEIRLNGMNLPTNVNDIKDWSAAMADASKATKEQLDWLQELAVAAPFDPAIIADIYTAARAMNYDDMQARTLTKSILEFGAGMGLSNEQVERIIVNLRQMGTRGKITTRELNDLARGALVPLDDVLERVAVKMGITKEALTKLISKPGEGIEPQLFVDAFQEMVAEEPRFVGAMGRLGRTLEMATKNFIEFIANLGARNILTPVFGIIGERIASITDQFIKFSETGELIHTEKWVALKSIVDRVGQSFSVIVSKILDIAPSAESIADGIVNSFSKFADWLDTHQDDIVGWVQKAKDWIENKLIPAIISLKEWLFGKPLQEGAISKFFGWLQNDVQPFIQNTLIPQMRELQDFLFGKREIPKGGTRYGETDQSGGYTPPKEDQKGGALQKVMEVVIALTPLIPPLLGLLGAIGEVIKIAFGGTETQTFGEFVRDTLVPAIQDLTKWIEDHKTTLAWLVQLFVKGAVAAFIISTAIAILTSMVSILTTTVLGWLVTGDNFIKVLTTVGLIVAAIIFPFLALIAIVVTLAIIFFSHSERIKQIVGSLKDAIVQKFNDIKNGIINKISEMRDSVIGKFGDLKDSAINKLNELVSSAKDIGKKIIDGLASGILGGIAGAVSAISTAVTSITNTANSVLHSQSPSKVFIDIGSNIMEGMAIGIASAAGMAQLAMSDAIGKVAMPALAFSAASAPASVSNQSTINNYFSQTVHTGANHEPVIQDFAMMASIVGA